MWTDWIIRLCAVCAAASLADLLMPSGALKGTSRLVAGLALMETFASLAAEIARGGFA